MTWFLRMSASGWRAKFDDLYTASMVDEMASVYNDFTVRSLPFLFAFVNFGLRHRHDLLGEVFKPFVWIAPATVWAIRKESLFRHVN